MKTILSSACILALAGCADQEHSSTQSAAYYPNYFRSQVEVPARSDATLDSEQQMLVRRQVALERQQNEGIYRSTVENPGPESSIIDTGSISYVAPERTPPQSEQLPPPPRVGERTTGPAPIATPVAGKPGYVLSPFAPQAGYVDVTGLAPGSEAKDPYTGKIFRVP